MVTKRNIVLVHGAWADGSSRSKVIPLLPRYMVATEDQMIPPQAEEFMAKRMGAEIRKVASSHAAMISKPKEVSNLIMSAVESVGKSAKRTHISA